MNAAELNFTEAIQTYMEYLEHEQGASLATRRCYGANLRRFRRFLAERYEQEPTLGEVTTDDCRAFLYHLSRQGLRPRTLRGIMHAVRGLFQMGVERGYRPDNPARAVKLPKKDAARRITCSDEELEQLLAGCEREPDPTRRALARAVMALLIYSGLRRQELLDLRLGDVDLDEGKVVVRAGKGSKSRTVFVCRACVRSVREWLAVRPPAKHDHLLVIDRARRLGESGLSHLLRDIRWMAGLGDKQHITPHAIRHAAATRLLRNGADLRSIQQFLGHSQLQTTAMYLHTDEQQLQKIAELTAFPDAALGRDEPQLRPSAAGQPRHAGRRSMRDRTPHSRVGRRERRVTRSRRPS